MAFINLRKEKKNKENTPDYSQNYNQNQQFFDQTQQMYQQYAQQNMYNQGGNSSYQNEQQYYDQNQMNYNQQEMYNQNVDPSMYVNQQQMYSDNQQMYQDNYSNEQQMYGASQVDESLNDQVAYTVNMEAINNMKNIDVASQEPVPEEPPKVEEPVEKLEEQEPEVKLDPLNNANNPIPVNPVAVDVVVDDSEAINAKTGFFTNVGMCIGLIFQPATTIVRNSKKYKISSKAFSVYLWMIIFSLALCVASRLVLGSIVRVYSPITGKYNISFDMSRMFALDNYFGWLIATIIISGLFVLLVAIVYYACSFMNSKGISFGSYLMLATLGCVPFTAGFLILFPLGGVISPYLGLILLFVSFLYGFLIFTIGVINVLQFDNVDGLVRYNLINMAIIGSLLAIIIIVVIKFTSYDISYLLSLAGVA